MPEENFEKPIAPLSAASSAYGGDQAKAPKSINRPAEGARIASPDDVLEGSFGNSESAGDFLGLDTELTSAMESRRLELSKAPESNSQADSWSASARDSAPGSLLSSPDSQAGSYLEDDESFFDDADPSEFSGEYDEEGDEDSLQEFEGQGDLELEASTGKLKLVLAFAAGLSVVLGVTMGPRLWTQFSPSAPLELAQATEPEAALATQVQAPGGSSEGTLALEASPVIAPSSNQTASVEGIAPSSLGSDASNTPRETGLSQVAAATSDALAAELAQTSRAQETELAGAEGLRPEVFGFDSDPLANLTTENSRDLSSKASLAGGFPNFSGDNFRWATPDDLDMIWRGQEIPMEAIQAPARMMMPFVGMVRATLTNGDSLDGKLHALGEGSVWLRDVKNGGLLGLDGKLVSGLERIVTEASASLSQQGSSSATLSKRVRVKLLGGTIAGTLISRDGEWVTIRTASGGNIRLHNPEMEAITQERVILLRD